MTAAGKVEQAPEVMVRGAIQRVVNSLPRDQQREINACADRIREAVKDAGPYGTIALALVAAETDAEAA